MSKRSFKKDAIQMNSYYNRYFVSRKNYTDFLPPDLKRMMLNQVDLVTCSALSLTNKIWNLHFQEIFSQSAQVIAIQAHVREIKYKPECVEKLVLQILQTPTVQSVNLIAKWIIAKDILCVRNLMAMEVLKSITYLIDGGILDEDHLQETKNIFNGARNDPDFVTDLAVNPKALKEVKEYFLHAKELNDESNLKAYIEMTSDYIENFDTSNHLLASIPEDFALLKNLKKLTINGIELDCKNEILNLPQIREDLCNTLLNLDFEPYHYKG
jgi:hypothetical protein